MFINLKTSKTVNQVVLHISLEYVLNHRKPKISFQVSSRYKQTKNLS